MINRNLPSESKILLTIGKFGKLILKNMMKNFIFLTLISFIYLSTLNAQKLIILDFKENFEYQSLTTITLTNELAKVLENNASIEVIEWRDDALLAGAVEQIEMLENVSKLATGYRLSLKRQNIDYVVFGNLEKDDTKDNASLKITFQNINGENFLVKKISIDVDSVSNKEVRLTKLEKTFKNINLPVISTGQPRVKNYTVPARTGREAIEDIEVKPSVGDLSHGMRINIKTALKYDNHEIYYKIDDEDYKLFPKGFNVIRGLKADTITIKLVSKEDGSEAGPFVRNDLFRKVIKERLKVRIAQGGYSRFVECSTEKCEIRLRNFCNLMAAELSLSRYPDKAEFLYNLKNCDDDLNGQFSKCFSPGFDIFPLQQGQKIYCKIKYADDDIIPFESEVKGDNYSNRGRYPDRQWVDLEPLNENTNTPFASAILSGGMHPEQLFEVHLGMGGCIDNYNRITYYYDIDGKGFVEAQGRNSVKIPLPNSNSVSFAAELSDGTRVGPFKYKFNAEDIINASAKAANIPKIEFGYDREHKTVIQAPGRQGSVLSWMNVKEVKYGIDNNELSESHTIEADVIQLIRKGIMRGMRQPGAVLNIDVPDDIEDIYYQVIYKDAKKSSVYRLKKR